MDVDSLDPESRNSRAGKNKNKPKKTPLLKKNSRGKNFKRGKKKKKPYHDTSVARVHFDKTLQSFGACLKGGLGVLGKPQLRFLHFFGCIDLEEIEKVKSDFVGRCFDGCS
jgi:hypothetical protein